MIYYDLSHGSPEWFSARIGLATASCFSKVITAKTRKPSAQADGYMDQLIAELVLQENLEKFPPNYWMERGALLENEASLAYEFETGLKIDRGGFLTNDAGTYGASPDRRIRDPKQGGKVIGALEIKCPAPWTHVGNLRSQAIDMDYYPQVQGQMMIGGFEWVDWFSYHPDMAPSLIRTKRDDAYIADLQTALDAFIVKMDAEMQKLVDRGALAALPVRKPPPPETAMPDYLSAG